MINTTSIESKKEENSLLDLPIGKSLVEKFQKPENYEVFYEAMDGEKILKFEVFKNFVAINLLKDGNEFFKSMINHII